MKKIYTTRQSMYNVESLFPFLTGKGRKSYRLHPRREDNLDPGKSKIGGSVLWPKSYQKPFCNEKGISAIPVLQVLKSEFEHLEFYDKKDVLQIFWYPDSYEEWSYNPKIEVYWWTQFELKESIILEPEIIDSDGMFAIKECCLSFEEVIEYPYISMLSAEEQEEILAWERSMEDEGARYQYCLSTCPGTKIGGYPDFGGQDHWIPENEEGKELEYVLTISDNEWDGGSFPRWRPLEQESPPGKMVLEEQSDGGLLQYTKYTEEDKEELESWDDERYLKYHDEQGALGTYLKIPMNIFFDKSRSPWRVLIA